MRSSMDASLGSCTYCPLRISIGMSAIYALKSTVEGAFYAIFQIVKGTTLARQWLEDKSVVKLYTMDEYIDLCISFLQRLKPTIAIERFISQSPKDMLLAPDWGVKNYEFVDKLNARIKKILHQSI